MRLFFWAVLVLVLVSCGVSGEETPRCEVAVEGDAGAADASVIVDGGQVDAGAAVDAGRPSLWPEVRRLLSVHCAGCHTASRVDLEPRFLDDPAVFDAPSKRCPGRSVGACVGAALENQAMEGQGCRTYVLEPFHREGWRCMAFSDIEVVRSWVAAGLPRN
jgi:hypothetical protein